MLNHPISWLGTGTSKLSAQKSPLSEIRGMDIETKLMCLRKKKLLK